MSLAIAKSFPGHATRCARVALGVAFALGLSGGLPGARAEEASKAGSLTVIVDGSGSMWGTLKGGRKPKIELVQQLLKTALGEVKPVVRLGLASFGHRRKGDCADAEVLALPAPGDLSRVLKPLAKIDPKGKGPLTQALLLAAGALDDSAAGPDHIVLIHDDPDNCRDDVCPVAIQVKALHPKVVLHTISLGMDSGDVAAMACVAKAAGGRAFDVRGPEDLANALAQLTELVNTGVQGEPAAPVAASRPAKSSPALAALQKQLEKPDGPPGLALTARLGTQGEAVTTPVRWRVFGAPKLAAPSGSSPSGSAGNVEPGEPVAEAYGARADIALAAGSYSIEAKAGLITERRSVMVEAKGPTPVDVTLAAGRLVVRTLDRAGGTIDEGTALSLHAVPAAGTSPGGGASKCPEGCPLWMGEGAGDLLLASGSYVLRLERGRLKRRMDVSLAAGQTLNLDVPLGTGRLQLRALERDGGASVRDPIFTVTEEDPEAPQGRREIGRSAALEPEFTLAPGTYVVSVEAGAAQTRERVSIEAGGLVSRAIVMNLGKLQISSRFMGSGPSMGDEEISYRITALDRDGKLVLSSTQALQTAAEIDLGAGRYRIESALGRQNAKDTRDVEVRAGQRTPVVIEVPAGRVALKAGNVAVPSGAAGPGDIVWEIMDSKGSSLWRTLQNDPVLVLKAGRYVARLEAKTLRREVAFEVKAGETRTVEVGRE